MTTVDQNWIMDKMMFYMHEQHKVFMLNLRNQFQNFSPDLVELAINELIDTNMIITKHDENGREYVYIGPAGE